MSIFESDALISTKDIEEKLQNVQIYPATVRVEINDKFAKVAFQNDFSSNETYGILEKKNPKRNKGKKQNSIITKYSFSNNEGTVSLDEFTRAVLGVCISEQKNGNLYTTVSIIFRALIGKVGEVGIRPRPNQLKAIKTALKKLMGTIVDFKNAGEALQQAGYIDDSKSLNLKTSSILPACELDCTINGQLVDDVIYFDRLSPLLELAEVKNQIVRFPAHLLDVPNQNNTPLIIALKTYVLRRVAEIKLHKQMAPTITFDDVFKKCRIDNADKYKKADARNSILKLFQHLQNKEFITSYDVEKRGNSIYGVKFSFVPKSKA